MDIDRELEVCERVDPAAWPWLLQVQQDYLPEKIGFIVHARIGYPDALRRLKRLREILCSQDNPLIREPVWPEVRELLGLQAAQAAGGKNGTKIN